MLEQPQIAYNIEIIHDCIVRDTEIYRKFKSKEKKLALYRKKKKLLDKHPELNLDLTILTRGAKVQLLLLLSISQQHISIHPIWDREMR